MPDLLLALAVFSLFYAWAASPRGLVAVRAAWDRRTSPLFESLSLEAQAPTWYLATFSGVLAALVLGTLLLGFLGGFALAALVAMLPFSLLQMRFQKRVTSIDRQLPAALDALASALKSGQSLPQAVTWVAQEGQVPINSEFAKLSREMALGASLEEGMVRMTARVPSKGLRSFSMTLEPLRAMGANLIPALQGMADVLRRRQATTEKLATLAAQAKMQLVVMTSLLPGLSFVMFLLEPKLMANLLREPLGHFCIALALALEFGGMIMSQHFLNPKKLWD